jgi:hypothetical protein
MSCALLTDLPPRAAAGARWVAVASTTVTTSGRSITTRTSAIATTTAATVAALRSTSPAAAAASAEATAASHAANIASGGVATATTTSTTTTATTEARAFASDGLEEARDLLVGLLEQLEEITDDTTVATVEERCGDTSVSGTSSTTDAVDVVVNVSGEIVVDNVCDLLNISFLISEKGGDYAH